MVFRKFESEGQIKSNVFKCFRQITYELTRLVGNVLMRKVSYKAALKERDCKTGWKVVLI